MTSTNSGRTDRNVAAVTELYERYRDAYETHRIPAPRPGLLVWAPGAVVEVGEHLTTIDSERDFAQEPLFMDIEAQFFWAAIPDWRASEVRVVGDGDEVFSFVQYSGTSRAGDVLTPIWTADRWLFDDQGRILRWLQVTDIGAWGAWQALNTETDYITHISEAFAAAGAPPRFVP